MTRYAKALLAAVGAVATWGVTAGVDDKYTQAEYWGAVAAVVTALGVYFVPNRPPIGEQPDPGMSEQDVFRPDPNSPDYGK